MATWQGHQELSASVIIPTLNAAGFLVPLHEALASQTVTPSEVVVIDSASDDDTVAISKSFGWRTHIISRDYFDHGATRNLGAELARHEYLVFLSQDACPADADWLEALVRPLANAPEIGATYSRQLARPEATARERYLRLRNYPPESHEHSLADVSRLGIKALFFSNVSSATRRDAFARVGGFPQRAILNEDGYFAARLLLGAYRVRYVAESRVLHSHDYSLSLQFRRYFDIGVSHADGPELFRRARTGSAGARFALEQIAYLLRSDAAGEIIKAVPELAAKIVAYRLGRSHQRLPPCLRTRLTWNKGYWRS